MDRGYTDMVDKLGLKFAFLTDPNGTYIELTGRAQRQVVFGSPFPAIR